MAALRSPDLRRALEIEPDDGGLFRKVVLDKLDQWWAVADGDIDYEPDADASIGAVARRSGQDPMRPGDRPAARRTTGTG